MSQHPERPALTEAPGVVADRVVAVPRWPVGALVLLIGPAGCGKSTWAARRFRPDQILSSDAFRALVAGDATDQSASADAFRLLHLAARARLARGLLTVVDATNLTAPARLGLRDQARRAGRPVVAVVFDVPLERCLAQNASRPGRQVPEAVVRRHHRELGEAMAFLPTEGYADIHVITAPDLPGQVG
jgi:protein phosphatase